jgi:hypothetical protein
MKRAKQVKRKKLRREKTIHLDPIPRAALPSSQDFYMRVAEVLGISRLAAKRALLMANYTPPPVKVAIHHDEEWATADGRRIKVCDMKESHVRNALRMTIRRDRKRALDRISRIVRSLPMPVDRMRTHVVDRDAVEALAGDLALDYGDSQGDQ